jgi:transcriptional regulator with XRE-family HTH domain
LENLSSVQASALSAGERLREERIRLALKQEEAAQIGGVTRNTQGSYERDERRPDTGYLEALYGAGLDVLFVVTGVRAPTSVGELGPDETILVSQYRSIPPDDQKAVRRFLKALADDATKGEN